MEVSHGRTATNFWIQRAEAETENQLQRTYFLIFWDFFKNRKSQLLAEVIEMVVGQGLCKYHYSILPIVTRRKVYTCYCIFNDIGCYILDVSYIPTKRGGGGGYASCFAAPMVKKHSQTPARCEVMSRRLIRTAGGAHTKWPRCARDRSRQARWPRRPQQ